MSMGYGKKLGYIWSDDKNNALFKNKIPSIPNTFQIEMLTGCKDLWVVGDLLSQISENRKLLVFGYGRGQQIGIHQM